jgi:methyl-accepting chemotaxis protein
MDDTTQQNAALVEQAAAAAQSMQDQAAELAQMVDMFKLEDKGFAAATARPAPVKRPPAGKRPSLPDRATVAAAAPRAPARVKPLAIAKADDWEEF